MGRSVSVLSSDDRRKMLAVTILQMSLGFLDLLGVLAIGLLGALSVTGLQSQKPIEQIDSVIQLLHISEVPFQSQVAILGTSAVVLLVGRTIISIFFTRRVLFFLSRRGAKISSNLISRLLSQPLLTIQARTTQESLFAVTGGVSLITMKFLALTVLLVSDVSMMLVMAIGLFLVDPITAAGTFLIFAAIGFTLYRILHVSAGVLGLKSTELTIKSSEKILEVFASYRESVVRNRRDFYAREIGRLRFDLADTSAQMSFMPYISKYTIETAIVLGAVLIGLAQFILQDASHAVATIAIFLAAGTRIAPAVLRVQQSSIQIRGALGSAMPTLDLIDALGNAPLVENIDDSVDVIHEGFVAKITVESVSLTYPTKNERAIADITLTIPMGSTLAFVGASGAGKTTIVDVLLGVLNPDAGRVTISGLPPLAAVAKWPGAVSYVPQDVVIANGTVRENIALGYPIESASDDLVMSAVKIASLDAFVAGLPKGLDTPVGERGAKISGGQRQRLGIARAMFTKPHLLVLDEATSSLDAETEASISRAIHTLKGSTTIIMIAHRLSTVRNADIVVYLAQGKIIATGSFDFVRNAVPDFDRQAKLMGL